MTAEERTATAIEITREVLKMALSSPFTMVEMTGRSMNPNDVQDQVTAILCYLEKTNPKKSTEDPPRNAYGLTDIHVIDEDEPEEVEEPIDENRAAYFAECAEAREAVEKRK
ncbi:hypothetical protein ES703_38500 [subsurface metagenome]